MKTRSQNLNFKLNNLAKTTNYLNSKEKEKETEKVTEKVNKNSQPIKTNKILNKTINKSYKKQKIPKKIKEEVWNQYFKKKYESKCYIKWCSNDINVFNFQVGHNIPESKGGTLSLGNLKPICDRCNYSMGAHYTIDEWNNKIKTIPPKSRTNRIIDYVYYFYNSLKYYAYVN
tara:strand:- start:2233 stop:2751 length:519 start_codon:yes stop_codon:yes gene_type:complete